METPPDSPPLTGNSPATTGRRRLIVIVAVSLGALLVCGGIGWIVFGTPRKNSDTSKYKALVPRQPASALDQYYLENRDRIFVNYDDIVGPGAYIKSYSPTAGADISFQFPVRRHMHDPLPVRLPDGTTITRHEMLAAVVPGGLISTNSRPQEDAYNPRRVYQLESGLRFRGWYVTDRPPDPEGREGRDQDGVHTVQLPEGRRFEITYQGGVPDGPFKAFRADGTPWGEATYRTGRVVEAWIITRSGRRFDELKDSKAADTALTDEAKAEAETLAQRGLGKLAAQDFAGAIADFTAAIGLYSSASYYLSRSDAKLGLGNIDGAIQDCQQARYGAQDDTELRHIEQKLKDLQQRRPAR